MIKHNTTQHNTTQHNTTQHNTTQHNTTQHNTTQHNTTQLIILSILLAISILSSIFIHFYAFNRTAVYIDTIYRLYDMKQYYEAKTIPVVGNRLMNPQSVEDNTSYARIPGGFYYILYLFCYTLGGASIAGTRIIYIILCALILILFLFWIYKRFSLCLCDIYETFLHIIKKGNYEIK